MALCYSLSNVIGGFAQPTYSAHLVRPFLHVLNKGAEVTREQYAAVGKAAVKKEIDKFLADEAAKKQDAAE